MEREQFENKKVFLWGTKQANKKLLKEFDKGDQHPNRRAKVARQAQQKEEPAHLKEFTLGEDYGVNDLSFLNEEYDRIDNLLSKETDEDEYSRLEDLQDKLYELIEGLENMKRLHGSGFKKGSPEAKAHAEKMRAAREHLKSSLHSDFKSPNGQAIPKEQPKPKEIKKSSKARVEKGSEEAKALGKRLAEAKKAKASSKPKPIEEPKQKKLSGKPYYYIGDIPKGYREATEVEAIKNNKVSEYGKYVVDSEMYRYFRDYGILLNPEAPLQEVHVMILVLKKKTLRALEDIEIFSSKLENPKYSDRKEEFETKLRVAKDCRKVYNAMYNFYWKIWCERKGLKYERIKIERPVREIIETTKDVERYEPKENIIIDPRTGKPVPKRSIEDIEKGFSSEDLTFERDGQEISLNRKYFDSEMKLLPKYSKKLLDKKIILEKDFYTDNDYKKNVYHKAMNGMGLFKHKHDIDNIQSVVFHKDKWNLRKAKLWLKKEGFKHFDADEKLDTYRFRQKEPDSIPSGYHYISKPVMDDSVILIMFVRNPVKLGTSIFSKTHDFFTNVGNKISEPFVKADTAVFTNKKITDAMILSGKWTKDYIMPAVIDIGLPIYFTTAATVGGLAGGPIGSAMALKLATKLWQEKGDPNRPQQQSLYLKQITDTATKLASKKTNEAYKPSGPNNRFMSKIEESKQKKQSGEGIKKRGHLNEQVVQKLKRPKKLVIEIVKEKPLSKKLRKVNNKSLNQYLEALEEKENKESRKLLKESAIAQKKLAEHLGL